MIFSLTAHSNGKVKVAAKILSRVLVTIKGVWIGN
jgi:hypothetical protein